jgi:hypothetical protein
LVADDDTSDNSEDYSNDQHQASVEEARRFTLHGERGKIKGERLKTR